ncbi:MAG: type I-U CRISPR-associated protein Cas7 [Planctomycetales bacterium]|nr:type I-U CRISPR-associated protein Cas7 [Planctomycetales bacterium]
MALDLSSLDNETRILLEVPLKPIQGHRFQPTGFPDLGAATYQAGNTACLLVESAQSMANRIEGTIWDDGRNQLIDEANGLSYVQILDASGNFLTSSITESHRINSPYILEGKDKTFLETLRGEFAVMETGPVDRARLAATLFKYDINSLLHGVFLAKKELAGGRLRIARAVSSFIEAEMVQVAASGGVKNDHVDPQGESAKGFGNVPFHREEFTAQDITAYFSVDLQQIHAYGLGPEAERLLTVLALYKIRRLLDGSLRLRTACDLELKGDGPLDARRPRGFTLPKLTDLSAELKSCIGTCSDQMEVTTVTYKK